VASLHLFTTRNHPGSKSKQEASGGKPMRELPSQTISYFFLRFVFGYTQQVFRIKIVHDNSPIASKKRKTHNQKQNS
jgi:hypothetical protein